MSLTGTSPTWLDYTPQTFLGAMEAGTAAGQREKAQTASESEAGDRLRLAYDSLASHERMQNEVAQQRLSAQQNAMALREAQMRGLNDYRQQRLGQFDTEEQRKQSASDSLDAHRQHMEDVASDKATAMANRGDGEFFSDPEAPGQVFFRQNTGHVMKVVGQPPATKVRLNTEGIPQAYSGSINDPTIKTLMGTNAPSALQPHGAASALTATPAAQAARPGFLSKAADWLTSPFKSDDSGDVQPILPGAGAQPPAADALAAPGAAPASVEKRVKVVGPSGQKGTIPEGADLPDGWKLAE